MSRKRSARNRNRPNPPLARLAALFGLKRARPAAVTAPSDDIACIAESGLFDAAFYLAQRIGPELRPGKRGERSKPALIAHYLTHGAALWLDPSRGFDTGFYMDTHPEIGRSGENPLLHYLRQGRAAGDPPRAAERSEREIPSALMAPDAGPPRKTYLIAATLSPRNTTRYRARHLLELLGGAAPEMVDLANLPDDFFDEVERDALVILQRVPFRAEHSAFLTRLRAVARLIVYDIDDQIFDATELETWRIRGLDAPPSAYARAMALADHFLVSTTGLRDRVERRFGKPAHVVTNCLGGETVARSGAARRMPDADGPFVVGYASGSPTHEEDLAVALPAIERFLKANPHAEFHCIGRMAPPEALQAHFGERVRYRKAVPWPELPSELAGFSVQIVPLADCAFNACKSRIRHLEAAAVGVPSIVSAVGEPGVAVFHGVTGLVCGNDTDAWVDALQALHDDAALTRRLGEAARHLALSYYTTASPFMQARARRIFADLELGFRRDKLSIVVTGGDAPGIAEATRAATSLPFETLVLGAASADAPANELAIALPEGTDPTAGRAFLAGIAGEPLLAFVADEPPPRLWDIRLVQAAKAAGCPALAGAATRDGSLSDRLMLATATVFRRIASSPGPADAAGRMDDAARARRLGLPVIPVRGLRDPPQSVPATGPASGPQLAIKICTPVAPDENVWGDTHFAHGLKSALEPLGYAVRIDKREEWHMPGRPADIALHLHGITPYQPEPGRTNILWIISHPEDIAADLLRAYDIVFCASEPVAERARRLAPDARVATLQQCTDPAVFSPDPAVARDIDVVFVGNSRRVYRDAVRFAVEEGFDVAIWGTRWEKFVDRRHIRGTSLTTREVAGVYRRAKVVLNDHWADQRREGLVNNRVFDVLACDTMVLSDASPGLAAILGGAVPTFSGRTDFAEALRALLADPDRDARAAALGAEVRRAHTFAVRAAAIDAAIAALRNDPPIARRVP